jgi:hypothetical protein
MALDRRTIAEMDKDGFTHIDARCAGCGRIAHMPFRLLLTRRRITTATDNRRAPPLLLDAKLRSSHTALFASWRLGGSMG